MLSSSTCSLVLKHLACESSLPLPIVAICQRRLETDILCHHHQLLLVKQQLLLAHGNCSPSKWLRVLATSQPEVEFLLLMTVHPDHVRKLALPLNPAESLSHDVELFVLAQVAHQPKLKLLLSTA